jgi:hypothetical protein
MNDGPHRTLMMTGNVSRTHLERHRMERERRRTIIMFEFTLEKHRSEIFNGEYEYFLSSTRDRSQTARLSFRFYFLFIIFFSQNYDNFVISGPNFKSKF